MCCGGASNRVVAGPGDPGDLALVVDRRCRRRGVARQDRKLVNLISLRSPHDGSELEHLWRRPRRIADRVLGPPDDLPVIVRRRGVAVGAPQRRQRSHDTRLPDEAEASAAGGGGTDKEGEAAPVLAPGIGRIRLRDPDDQAPRVLHRPRDVAVLGLVRASKRSEVNEGATTPERGYGIQLLTYRPTPGEVHTAPTALAHRAGGAQVRTIVLGAWRRPGAGRNPDLLETIQVAEPVRSLPAPLHPIRSPGQAPRRESLSIFRSLPPAAPVIRALKPARTSARVGCRMLRKLSIG
jgi:hypothetical protein